MVSSFDEELRPFLGSVKIMRLVKKMQRICREYPGWVMAAAEPGEPTAPGMLERFGFRYGGDVDGDAVYLMGRE